MNNSNKLLLGILTFLPIILISIYFYRFFSMLLYHLPELQNNSHEVPINFIRSVFGAFIFLILAVIIKLGLMIYYIIHASDNINNDNTKKIIWILILVFIGTIGNIIYYFMEILPSDKNKITTLNIEK